MAKVRGPLFSLDASGQFGKTLVFAVWKGIRYVRRYVIPENPRTALQVAQRQKFADAVASWHALNSIRQLAWKAAAASLEMTGFNYFIQQALKQNSSNPDIPGKDNTPPDAPTNLHATGISGGVRLSWDPPTSDDVWGYAIFGSKESGFTPDNSSLIGETTDTAFTDYITDGSTHYYRVKAIDKSGNYSEPTDEVSGTPT